MGVTDSDNDIRSVVFSYNGNTTGDTIGMDDISFASNAVAEPTSLALLGRGLFGFVASRRKSSKNKNA
ncbi:PEP-CTERM sorting domain-containing protein [Glaciimonas sp. Cout2]|uniref:PEP-CTERM sorting domain-containing protein n=1 Tax=unclassified Glaciimonas TaxID=2644401 RepID=UPI0034DCEE38